MPNIQERRESKSRQLQRSNVNVHRVYDICNDSKKKINRVDRQVMMITRDAGEV